MATTTQGILGGFSGRLGTVVGYQWNGKWCMRSRPQYIRNPRTVAQQARRNLFKAEVQLAAAMRWAVCQGFTSIARAHGMTAYNAFVSINQPCFSLQEGEFRVDWANLSLSEGPVAPVIFGAPSIDEHNVLTVSFDRNASARRSRGMDSVYVYVYCPELEQGFLTAPVYRRDRVVSAMLPETFAGHGLVMYGFVQDDKGVGSTTCFIAFGEGDGAPGVPSGHTWPGGGADALGEGGAPASASAAQDAHGPGRALGG